MGASNISESEWDDFHRALTKLSRDKADFEVREQVQSPPTAEPFPLFGTVAIKANKSKAQQTYRTGHGSVWVAEFEDDLNEGVFD